MSAAHATLTVLEACGHAVGHLVVRELPDAELLNGNAERPRVADALDQIERAEGLIVATPIFKASCSGLLRFLLDLLPQRGLAGKAVPPLATGGVLAYLLAVDYGYAPCRRSARRRTKFHALHLVGAPDYPVLEPRLGSLRAGRMACGVYGSHINLSVSWAYG